jgi:hypothetical protein
MWQRRCSDVFSTELQVRSMKGANRTDRGVIAVFYLVGLIYAELYYRPGPSKRKTTLSIHAGNCWRAENIELNST